MKLTYWHINLSLSTGLDANLKSNWPCRNSEPRIYWSFIIFTCPRNFTHDIIRHFMCLMWGKACWQECLLMFTGPIGPVELCFYWPQVIYLEFLLVWGQRFTVSVELGWIHASVLGSGKNSSYCLSIIITNDIWLSDGISNDNSSKYITFNQLCQN